MSTNCRRSSKTNSGPAENQKALPLHQRERVRQLHKLFVRVEPKLAAGATLAGVTKSFRWNNDGEPFRSDPSKRRRYRLATLHRLFQQWRRQGRVPSALLPRYRPVGPAVPLVTMQRFGKFYSRQLWPNVKVAWAEFSRRRHSGLPGRPRSKPRPISHGQVYYAFRGGWLAGLQARIRAVEAAQSELSEFQLRLDAMLRERLPHRPQRKRRTAADRSLEAACL